MSTWIEILYAKIAERDLSAIEFMIEQGIDCEVSEYESVVHRSFQIQRGSMNVPPSRDVIKILTSARIMKPMMAAIYMQDVKVMRSIVADDPSQLETRDATSYTPVLRASEICKTEVLRCLLDLGADIHATRSNGFGCVHLAGWNEIHPDERVDTLQLLLEQGCDVNAVSDENATALMLAAMCFKENSVAVLLKYGADVTIVSHENLTALAYAQGTDYSPCIDLLT
ncbi:MAG: ankyrin repeat domain-containing protein [Planctomycetes bacterium]|nr:ankyrin repeat domain-containing protein [Planctomycetota bacterium]